MLDLFSGIGGFALAASWVWGEDLDIAAFCEIEEYPCKVLQKNFPNIPIEKDIKEMNGYDYRPIDLLTGGFPCQPWSQAGKQYGTKDDRDLWPEMFRIIEETQPRWVVGENVTGIKKMVLDEICTDLENLGYKTESYIIPAVAKNAPHRRDRIWVVAHAKRGQWRDKPHNGAFRRMGWQQQSFPWDKGWESALCEFRGVDDGVSYGVDRLDAIRNAIVPQVAYEIMLAIREKSAG